MNTQCINLYVTYVEKEGPFLKIWGQTDKNNALYVEQFLAQVTSQLNLGIGAVEAETLPPGTLVCAKYKDEKYYRAKILKSAYVREGSLEVNFIDYGNKGIVATNSVRSLQNFHSSIADIPALAVGFILAQAHCVGGGEWNDITFENIAKEIKYREVSCILLTQATNHFLVQISIEGTDLFKLLTQRALMQPTSLQAQQAVLLAMSMQKQNHPVQSASSIAPEINTYKAYSLEPGLEYEVYVSYVNDGPCQFSVQLKKSEEGLVKLMNEINTINLTLLEDIPIPGTICLAKCIEDGNICRAVVTNEVDTMFKVFYVDFGNYEVLPLESLYHIPFKFVIPKVMAIRLALAGVEKSTVTMEMQIAFKKFVDNRQLRMKVLPSPTRTALPKCELWDSKTKTSALEVVIRSARHSYPEPVLLMKGFSQPVKVSFVFSCNRFYVQLVNKESELTSLMNELQDMCVSTDYMDPSTIKKGLPCCALFAADGIWYRSEIVDVSSEGVKVRYIDYGNEDMVSFGQLKTINGEILTVLRPQAIECCLNGYQKMEPDEERDALLEELLLEGVFMMKVIDTFDKKTLVDLFDSSNYNVASLLLDRLAAAKSQVSPVLAVQAGNKIEHKKSFPKQKEYQNFNKGDQKSNTGRDHKSWDKPYERNERNDRYERNDRSDRNDRHDRNDRNDRYDRNERNDRTEKPWRQDNRENRNFDRNSNEKSDDNSWRQNNKGFSPNNRFDKIRRSEDSWGATEKNVDNNLNQPSEASEDTWNTQDGGNEWDSASGNPSKREDHRNNRGSNNRYDSKPRDRDGGYKKREFRKDGSEASSNGSEKNYHKGPRSSSRNDRGYGNQNFDKPRNNYRDNNKHGGGGDSWNADTTAEDSWNVSSVTTSAIDAAPATANFATYDIVGSEGSVIISWFHNPGLFYVQQISSQETFKTLMEDICDFYKGKRPETVEKGAPVIALFDEDNVLYRAKILEIVGTQYKVYYVDFGNVSIVTKVFPIEKKFMNLPAQAIPCAIDGIDPPNGTWSDADLYGNYFDKADFICKFVNKDEQKTFVNIFSNSEDIGQLLVRDGLAVSTVSAIPDIEIPLLLGQQFRAVVKSVNNLSDVILALECGLAVSCTMHNLDLATEIFEEKLKSLLEQTVIVYVDNVLDYKLEITLYDTEGNKHVVLNPDEGAYEIVDVPCPMLVLRSFITGYVPHAEDKVVFVQPHEYADTVTALLNQLFEEYDGKENADTIIPEEGTLYAVHSEDGNWYRGKVISFNDEKATVNYVDYGNSEDVAFGELRELTSKFLDVIILSLSITVPSGGEAFIDKDITGNIYYGESGWEGTIQLSDSSSTLLIPQTGSSATLESADIEVQASTVEQENEISDELTQTENQAQPAPVVEESEISKALEIGNLVFMSHIDSPSDFYLQFFDNISAIEQLQAELQGQVTEMELMDNPVPGVLCAAPYSLDQQWYRAEVLDADEDITTVRFVDFGNTDVIDNKTTKVKTLSPKFLSLAIYATRCALKIEPIEEEWSSVAFKLFEQLTLCDNLRAEFIEQDEKCTYVELYSNGVNIKDAFIKENLAKASTKTVEAKQTGFVSHLNSPSEFWIQLENCVDELEWIAEQLSSAETFPELEELTPGTLCAALFPDDQMWYRARILSNTVAGIELLFIDYGNSCTSSSLRQLPEDLVMTAPLALKCSLLKNEGIPAWSPQAAEKFAEVSADGVTIFTVKKISAGETSVVQLFLNGQDVAAMLLPSTEEGTIAVIETLENLSIQKESGETVENVALEPLDGLTLDENAKEILEELSEQGSTKFQVEFVDEKSVRLYINGKDIRLLLGSFKKPLTPSHDVPSETHCNDIPPEEALENVQSSEIVENNETCFTTDEELIDSEIKHDQPATEAIETSELQSSDEKQTEEVAELAYETEETQIASTDDDQTHLESANDIEDATKTIELTLPTQTKEIIEAECAETPEINAEMPCPEEQSTEENIADSEENVNDTGADENKTKEQDHPTVTKEVIDAECTEVSIAPDCQETPEEVNDSEYESITDSKTIEEKTEIDPTEVILKENVDVKHDSIPIIVHDILEPLLEQVQQNLDDNAVETSDVSEFTEAVCTDLSKEESVSITEETVTDDKSTVEIEEGTPMKEQSIETEVSDLVENQNLDTNEDESKVIDVIEETNEAEKERSINQEEIVKEADTTEEIQQNQNLDTNKEESKVIDVIEEINEAEKEHSINQEDIAKEADTTEEIQQNQNLDTNEGESKVIDGIEEINEEEKERLINQEEIVKEADTPDQIQRNQNLDTNEDEFKVIDVIEETNEVEKEHSINQEKIAKDADTGENTQLVEEPNEDNIDVLENAIKLSEASSEETEKKSSVNNTSKTQKSNTTTQKSTKNSPVLTTKQTKASEQKIVKKAVASKESPKASVKDDKKSQSVTKDVSKTRKVTPSTDSGKVTLKKETKPLPTKTSPVGVISKTTDKKLKSKESPKAPKTPDASKKVTKSKVDEPKSTDDLASSGGN